MVVLAENRPRRTGQELHRLKQGTNSGKLEVAVVTTERAKHFYSPQDIPVTLYSDADEWEMWKCRSDPVLHIDLRRWADLMLVAPLDANTLGKVASGICDNLLTCVIRAWDRGKPLLFCPAMNTAMWEHPLTSQQVGQLQAFGYIEIPCVAKKLVCGDQGGHLPGLQPVLMAHGQIWIKIPACCDLRQNHSPPSPAFSSGKWKS
ncbi:PREDICTED: phosphopantothenoylcysteine decarboxylase isoform X3 [Myotis davidii]|uniref:phosphopantothenoylcysteine decarboxylase isoform X3 n=1 Tax=Myotis davidii TaxID=225400 RepID=UPI00076779F8|nr:PREDICTED: phosphopantothenoylcysteine decarboxylase isoform X3 [Myotis davidii]